HPGGLRDRGRDRAPDRPLAPSGRAGDERGAARGGRDRGRRGTGRLRPRRRRSARRRHRDGGAAGQRVDLDAPAPAEGRVHPRGPPDRHDGAPRGHLRLRGLEGPSGADLRGRSAPDPGGAGRPRRRPGRERLPGAGPPPIAPGTALVGAIVLLLVILAVIGLASGGGGSKESKKTAGAAKKKATHPKPQAPAPPPKPSSVKLKVVPTE